MKSSIRMLAQLGCGLCPILGSLGAGVMLLSLTALVR